MQRGMIISLVAVVAAVGIGVYVWRENQSAPPPQTAQGTAPSQAKPPTSGTPAQPKTPAQPAAPSAPQTATAPSRTAPAPAAVPQAPATSTPPAAAKPTAPSFDIVRVSPTGEAVIAGRAAPSAEVTVLDGEKTIATATADARGEWVVTPQSPLPPGNHELSLRAKGPGEAAPLKSENVVVVAVPEPMKPAASTTGAPAAAGAAPSQSLAVLVPSAGAGPARVLQAPSISGGAAARALTVEVIQYDARGSLGVSGRGPAQGRVLLYLDNNPIGEAVANAEGDWSQKARDPVPAGQYTLRADLVGPDGKVSSRVQLRFRRVEVPAELAGNQFLVVQPGNNLWRIARRAYGEGLLYTEIYSANRNEITDPNLIFPDQVVTLPQR